jgi:signal transduction histidine kinase
VRQSRELLTLVIEDNGRGFELSAKGMPRGAGLGVLGMRERAAMVGGVLAVESAPARGTRLSLRIPLADAAGRGAALAAGEGVKA